MRGLTVWSYWLLVGLASFGCARSATQSDSTATSTSATPSVKMLSDADRPYFVAQNLTAEQREAAGRLDADQLAGALSVYVDGTDADSPPVGGEVSREEDSLRFTPRHPLRKGVIYRVVFKPAALTPNKDANASNADVTGEFALARLRPVSPSSVAKIYPTTNKLPENQLKFYLHFSAPMSRGEAYRHIHLLDASGREIEAAFLELGEELWNPGLTRFTLLCDPGRVKRGLKPREELGPVLEAGKRYSLVVDRDWIDAQGEPLSAEVHKTFEVAAADESPLDTAAWKILPPQAGTRDPLVVMFPEPLDHSLLERMIAVVGPGDDKPAGEITIDEQETRWRFTPSEPWSAGSYTLVADTTLEDLAGNSIGRAFDVDVFAPVQRQITTETVSLPFEVK